MADFFRIAIVMEMLIANLFTVNLCAVRKYSKATSVVVLVGFTFILTYFTRGMWAFMGFDQGDASFALIGIVYLIPLTFLYREPLRHLLSSLFSAWVYTMVIYCLAVRVAYLWPEEYFLRNTFLVQSLLYLATFYLFTRWIQKAFLFMLRNITQRNRYMLQLVSLSWFISIIVINANLIDTENQWLKMISIIAIAVNALLSYLLIFSMVSSHKEIENLESIVYLDPLTKLYNRAGLFKDAAELIQKQIAFRLVFIDLNHFKQINDKYGHAVGDQYLICFAQETKALLDITEQLYRMSGDEFVIISRSRGQRSCVGRLREYPDTLKGMETPFLGFSVGWADFPEEETSLDKLIILADRRMYQHKQQNHSGSSDKIP